MPNVRNMIENQQLNSLQDFEEAYAKLKENPELLNDDVLMGKFFAKRKEFLLHKSPAMARHLDESIALDENRADPESFYAQFKAKEKALGFDRNMPADFTLESDMPNVMNKLDEINQSNPELAGSIMAELDKSVNMGGAQGHFGRATPTEHQTIGIYRTLGDMLVQTAEPEERKAILDLYKEAASREIASAEACYELLQHQVDRENHITKEEADELFNDLLKNGHIKEEDVDNFLVHSIRNGGMHISRNQAEIIGVLRDKDGTSIKDAALEQLGDEFNFKSAEDVANGFAAVAMSDILERDDARLQRFIDAKDKYLAEHPEDKEVIAEQMQRFSVTENDSFHHFGNEVMLGENFIDYYQEHDANAAQFLPEKLLNKDNSNEAMLNEALEGETIQHSAISDANDALLDIYRMTVLNGDNKKAKPVEEYTEKELVDELARRTNKMTLAERKDLRDKALDMWVHDDRYFELMPPQLLAESYENYSAEMAKLQEQRGKAEQKHDEKKLQQIDEKYATLDENKTKVKNRITDLTQQLVRDAHESDDLYFMNVNNIADVDAGYRKMFEVVVNDNQTQSENSQNADEQEGLSRETELMNKGIAALDAQMNNFLQTYHLDGVSEDNAEKLNKRIDKMRDVLDEVKFDKQMADTVIDTDENGNDVTFGQFVGKFRFGEDEPQFKLKGKPQLEYSEGAEIIEGSKLDELLTETKQLYIMQNLGTDDEVSVENAREAVTQDMPKLLYAMNVKSRIAEYENDTSDTAEQVFERPDEFTNEAYRQEFIHKVCDTNAQTLNILPEAFQEVSYGAVNQAYAWRSVLAKQLEPKQNDETQSEKQNENLEQQNSSEPEKKKGNWLTNWWQKRKERNAAQKKQDNAKSLLLKVCRPLDKIDIRAKSRNEKTVDGNVWKQFGKKLLQDMGAALLGTAKIKAALLAASLAASAATGVGVMSAMAVGGVVIGAGLTIKSIVNWNNKQKREGKEGFTLKNIKKGFTAFKKFVKDPDMMATLATTGLATAAVGFAMTGHPKRAVYAGAAAAVLGIGRAAVHDYKTLTHAGVKPWKAALASISGAAVKTGVIFAVNAAMQGYANSHFTHQELDQPGTPGQEAQWHTELRETPEMIEGAQRQLDSYYGHNSDALNHDLDQVRAELARLGDHRSPEVVLRDAVLSKMNTGIDTLEHIDGGGIHHTHGNHYTLTDSWCNQHGVDSSDVHALGGIKDADGNIHLDKDILAAHDNFKEQISSRAEVGHTIGSDPHHDGVLDRNASVDANTGRTTHDSTNPDRFDTYADFKDSGYREKIIIDREATPGTDPTYKDIGPEDTFVAGMHGVRNGGWTEQIAQRASALADGVRNIFGIKKKHENENHQENDNVVDEPIIIGGGKPKDNEIGDSQPVDEGLVVGTVDEKQPTQNDPVIPVVGTVDEKQPTQNDPVIPVVGTVDENQPTQNDPVIPVVGTVDEKQPTQNDPVIPVVGTVDEKQPTQNDPVIPVVGTVDEKQPTQNDPVIPVVGTVDEKQPTQNDPVIPVVGTVDEKQPTQNDPVIPVVGTVDEKQPTQNDPKPVQNENNNPQPEEKPIVSKQPEDDNSHRNQTADLLIDEYKTVHGLNGKKDMEPSLAEMTTYKKLVMTEYNADIQNGKTSATNLVEYLQERRNTFDNVIATAVSPLAEAKGFSEQKAGKAAINKVRQDMYTTKMSFNGEELPASRMTLQKMTTLAEYSLSNDGSRGKVTAAQSERKVGKPYGGTFDLATRETTGQTVSSPAGKAKVDARTSGGSERR